MAVATQTHPGTAEVVALASGLSWPDAVVAAPLAAANGGPLLLVGDELPDVTVDALRRLAPTRLLVVGGEAAVTPAVELAAADLVS
ncbi:MAG TPA: cell wall-binding repeat-containing protein [Euzebya sp.]|nr:cell wall-binding repeat-containing protein [Euzebya sp.]